jgi:hypothetical protein
MQMLLEVADAIITRDRYLPGVGLFLSQDELKERRFTVTVSSDKTQPITGIHLKTDVSEKLTRKIRLGKLVDLNHDRFFQRIKLCESKPLLYFGTPTILS